MCSAIADGSRSTPPAHAELALLSSQIDKQELRKFYFSVFSVLGLLAIILPLVLSSPRRRERQWLPQESEAILSLNVDQLSTTISRNAGARSSRTSGQAYGTVSSATANTRYDVLGHASDACD